MINKKVIKIHNLALFIFLFYLDIYDHDFKDFFNNMPEFIITSSEFFNLFITIIIDKSTLKNLKEIRIEYNKYVKTYEKNKNSYAFLIKNILSSKKNKIETDFKKLVNKNFKFILDGNNIIEHIPHHKKGDILITLEHLLDDGYYLSPCMKKVLYEKSLKLGNNFEKYTLDYKNEKCDENLNIYDDSLFRSDFNNGKIITFKYANRNIFKIKLEKFCVELVHKNNKNVDITKMTTPKCESKLKELYIKKNIKNIKNKIFLIFFSKFSGDLLKIAVSQKPKYLYASFDKYSIMISLLIFHNASMLCFTEDDITYSEMLYDKKTITEMAKLTYILLKN